MIRQFSILIRKNKALREEVEKGLADTMSAFTLAKALMSDVQIEEALAIPAASAEIECGKNNIMSVEVPSFKIVSGEKSGDTYPYAYSSVTGEADSSIRALSSVLDKLLELAEVEKACNMLADEIEKNKRRVNALEYVMIPQLEETIKYIKMKLEENDRGATTRLMKVKDMIAERN